jgi:predicted Zn-dependent protease
VIFLFFLLLSAAPPREARAETFTYWIEPCSRPDAECETGDINLAEWAIAAWEKAGDGALKFEKSPLSKARIRVYWASSGNQGLYGEARGIMVEGRPGAELNIRPGLHALGTKMESEGTKDPLFRDAIVYLTCLHELGHALGLPHTRSFADIMYSFEYGGNLVDYFGRYRRLLRSKDEIPEHPGYSAEDQKRLIALYKHP